MNAEMRRRSILERLKTENGPVSAAALAAQLGVSRQIIVGDVALLRACGAEISATPRGYMLSRDEGFIIRTAACCHSGGDMRAELDIMVDNGCIVRDVIVEHPIYGQIAGSLQLRSRYDVEQFIERSRETDAAPLSSLTDGIHLHTLLCPDERAYERVCAQLRESGFLLGE